VRQYPAILASITLAISLATGPAFAEQRKPDAKPAPVDRKGAADPNCSGQSLCNNENVTGKVKGDAKGKTAK
jgi:hypothetical protein